MLCSIILEIRNRKQQMNAMRRVIQLLPQVYITLHTYCRY